MSQQINSYRSILIVTAVDAEKEAVLRGLNRSADSCFDVITGGVGPVSAASKTATHIAKASKVYDLVISMGIAGGFQEKTEPGALVVADQIVAADLGVELDSGFSSIENLGFGVSKINVNSALSQKLFNAYKQKGIQVTIGNILTLATVTGTLATARNLTDRYPNAVAEAMEGFGVAFTAYEQNIEVIEIRSISNYVGPRDRSSWKIKEALSSLEEACALLTEVLS